MIEAIHQQFLDSSGISTDTRTIKKGDLFFALSGENFDGNAYVEKALQQAAYHIICSDSKWIDNSKVTVVPNVLETLQQLATFHRNYLNLPIIALTGSNGKTTTKELIVSVLSMQFKVEGTKGNLNNHIGVPLTLLSFDKTTQIGVVEMGANHPKEIAALCRITQPNFGLITNYGKAHLEGFGGIEGVKTSKSELYDYLRKSNGTAIIGRWDPEQIVRSAGIHQFFTPEDSTIYNTSPFISFIAERNLIKTQLTGTYNYHNALYAYTIGRIMEISPEQIAEGISKYVPSSNRSQIITKNRTTIILDAYNANPSSMRVALENLSQQNSKKKIAMLGDMFELGDYAKTEHQNISSFAESLPIDHIALIGENFYKTDTKRSRKFRTRDEAGSSMKINTDTEQVILIKGSRGMALEHLLDKI